MSDAADHGRVYWHSRRGMLELDLLLMPFAEQVYPSLAPEDQGHYQALLACEDADIFGWLLDRVLPTDPDIAHIVKRILAHGRAVSLNPD